MKVKEELAGSWGAASFRREGDGDGAHGWLARRACADGRRAKQTIVMGERELLARSHART